MILPTEEFAEIGKAELPLMANNQCGMGFLAGHSIKQTHNSCFAPKFYQLVPLPYSYDRRDVLVLSPLFLCRFCHPS